MIRPALLLSWIASETQMQGAPVDVASDVDAPAPEAALRDERVRGLEMRRRRPVSRLPLRSHRSPRQSGSV